MSRYTKNRPFKMMIAGGHGAGRQHNRGGVCFNEGDNNYYYSLELQKQMKEMWQNVQVDVLRKRITDNPSLGSRAKSGSGYDFWVAPHSNAAGATVRGTEVFDSVERPDKALGDKICRETSKFFKHNNRGTKYKRSGKQPSKNWYGELRNNKARVAQIWEIGFHTNPQDCSIFLNNRVAIAKMHARIVGEHFGLTAKSQPKPVTPPIDYETPSKWAKESWDRIVKMGVVQGSAGKLYPRKNVSREEVVVMLDRFLKILEERGYTGKQLTDKALSSSVSKTPSNWAKESWDWAISRGLVDGDKPKNNLTREQVATILIRYYDGISKQ